MAERIWSRWDAFCGPLPLDPPGIFNYWMDALCGRTTQPYITVTFLLHLLRPTESPIIDRYTFRAMNALACRVRPDWKGKQTPSSYDDLLTYTEFFERLLAAWSAGHETISRADLDKVLMVYGQRLKRRASPAQSARGRF
ncbi:MAG: hypothetical protein IMZ69_03335 [Spirochaetes bacterium]|nr:hypothetical protein [Spirochaetota bacterium]